MSNHIQNKRHFLQLLPLRVPLALWRGVRGEAGRGLLTAILFMGSVCLMAQTEDPFDEVDDGRYSNTMNITGYVRMGGEILGNETIVAVFQGDELRGKGSPKDYLNGQFTSLLMMTVYGDTNGQPLHFKVYTGGHVIEVAPDGFSFTINARFGQALDPYYIDLPEPVTTTFTEEGWATTCLPFNAKVPEGVTVWNATGILGSLLEMETVEGSILPANTPVLLSVDASDQPAYTCQWLSRVAPGDITTTGNIFLGTTEPTTVEAGSVLTLGHSNETGAIGFWRFTGTEVPANRAFIANLPAGVKGVRIYTGDPTTTGIDDASHLNDKGQMMEQREQCELAQTLPSRDRGRRSQMTNDNHSAVYDLQGRRVNGQLSTVNGQWSTVHGQRSTVNGQCPAIYIRQGKKYFVRQRSSAAYRSDK